MTPLSSSADKDKACVQSNSRASADPVTSVWQVVAMARMLSERVFSTNALSAAITSYPHSLKTMLVRPHPAPVATTTTQHIVRAGSGSVISCMSPRSTARGL
jgi:hypothetical protein